MTPEPVPPSPKSHAYDEIVPSTSLEPPPLNDAFRNVELDVNEAVGGGASVTVTGFVTVPVMLLLSVTVRVTW